MASEKKSFLLFTDTATVFSALEDEQAGALIKAIVEYVRTGEEPLMEPAMLALFMIFKKQIDATQLKWEETKEKRREAGRLGGLQTQANASKRKQMLDLVKQTQANQAVTVTVTDTVIKEKDISKDISKKKDARPSIEECKAYFLEIGAEAEADRFYNYYTANGWRVGKNPMKDWKAAARGWKQRASQYTQAPVDRAKALGKVVDRQEPSGHDILQMNRPFRLKVVE